MAGRYVELARGRMHVVDVGKGPTVLCVHGNPTWSYLYRNVARALAGSCRVVAPDQLGFGLSDKPDLPPGLDEHIANLAELVSRLDLRGITLVVHDWGGPIGLGFATAHADRIAGLVLLNTWAFVLPAGTRLPALLEAIRTPGVGEELVLVRNALVEQGIPAGMHRRERVTQALLDGYRGPTRDRRARQAVLALVREIPLGAAAPAARTMARIQAGIRGMRWPAAIVWGERDPVFPPGLLALWQAYLPAAEVRRLPGASHFVPEDAPEEVAAVVREMVARPGAGAW